MKLSIIYAYRNRDIQRIWNSLNSLKMQTLDATSFEVIFVDYGSEHDIASKIKEKVEKFTFASYHYIAHPGLLWNKSKALNYAASKANGDFIFVADVDICFQKKAVSTILRCQTSDGYTLYKLSYLKEKVQQSVIQTLIITESHIKHHGSVNGMVLVSKENFFKVNGYDEFYHFYGSEDVDFYQRLKNLGLEEKINRETLFFHQWHPIYNSIDDTVLEKNPRFFNIKRINQQHFFYQQKIKTIKPLLYQKINQNLWNKEDELTSANAVKSFSITNDHAKVWHLMHVILPTLKKTVIEVIINEDTYFKTAKFKLKKKLKKSDRVPISMKDVNDMILGEILLNYRDHNYSYTISSDLKTLIFVISL